MLIIRKDTGDEKAEVKDFTENPVTELNEDDRSLKSAEIPEKFYEELYSKADILYFRLDDDLSISSCNSTSEEKLIYERESLIRNSFLNFLPDSDRDSAHAMLQTCLNKGYIQNFEIRLQMQNRQILFGLLNGLVFQNREDEGRFLRLYIRDITQVKNADLINRMLAAIIHAQKNNESQGNSLYKNIAELFSCDGAGISLRMKGGDSVISGFWSGMENRQDFGAKDFRRWHSQIWTLMIQKCQKVGAGQWSDNSSFWTGNLKDTINLLREQGEKQVFESLGSYESLALISMNSLESQQGYFILLDRHAERWDEPLIQMLESVSSYMFTAVKPNAPVQDSPGTIFNEEMIYPWMNVPVFGIVITQYGMIRHANPWVETHMGLACENLIGKSFKEIVSVEHHAQIDSIRSEADEIGHFKSVGDISIKNFQGNDRHVQCVLTSIQIGDSLCELWYLLDVREDADLLSRLQQSKKLEALGILAGGIVYDFNNLLSTITGFTTLLKEEISKDKSIYKDVIQISETTERAIELTSRLLAYAHGKSYLVENLNINQLINEVAGILSRTLDKNFVIRTDLEKELFTIPADAGQIQQTILQVALNAREAMPHGGSLVFQSRNLILGKDDPRLKKECHPGNYIQIVISDTGMGMSSHVKEQIFEPHFSTKDQSPGRGLGLTIVRQNIEQAGGFVSVFSEIQKGTVFKIHIPANSSKITAALQRTVEQGSKVKTNILIIDNDRNFLEMVRRTLSRYGYRILIPDSAQDALSMARKYKKSIGLVILDILIPGPDIRKMISAFRKLNTDVRILATLPSGDRKKIPAELVQGCEGMIQKPFQLSSLLKLIQSTLNN